MGFITYSVESWCVMYLLIIGNFILTCCVGIYLYIQLKEREDEIEELYDLHEEHIRECEYSTKIKKKKEGKVFLF